MPGSPRSTSPPPWLIRAVRSTWSSTDRSLSRPTSTTRMLVGTGTRAPRPWARGHQRLSWLTTANGAGDGRLGARRRYVGDDHAGARRDDHAGVRLAAAGASVGVGRLSAGAGGGRAGGLLG